MSEPTSAPEVAANDDARENGMPVLTDEEIQRLRSLAADVIRSQILSLMQERHNREVEITKLISSLGDGTLRLTLRTTDDVEPPLLFTARIEDEEVFDTYAANRCVYPLVKAVEESLAGARACVTLLDDEDIAAARDGLTLAEYLDQHGDRSILLHLVMQEGAEVARAEARQTIQEISRVFSADVALRVWTLPEAGFDRCQALFDSNAWVTATLIDNCDPIASWSALIHAGTVLNEQKAEVG